MGVTFTNLQPQSAGSEGKVEFKLNGDTSYPTGGYTVPAVQIGLFRINRLNVQRGVFSIVDIITGNTTTLDVAPVVTYPDAFTAKVQFFNGSLLPVQTDEAYPNVKGSLNTNSENVDTGALPTNGNLVATATVVAAGAWTVGAITNPDIQRNILIEIDNPTAGNLNLFQGVMTFTIVGTRNGVAQTEFITFTSNVGNKVVGIGQFRLKYGIKTFDTITSVTLDHVPDNGLQIGVGIGSKIGLINPLANQLTTDVSKVTKNGVDVTGAVTIDPLNITRGVNFGTLVNGDDIDIVYQSGGGQVPNGTDVSFVSLFSDAYGY